MRGLQHLSVRLTLICLVCGVLLGGTAALLQFALEYRRADLQIQQDLQTMVVGVRESAITAAEERDISRAKAVLNRVFFDQAVVQAQIAISGDEILADRSRHPSTSEGRGLSDLVFGSFQTVSVPLYSSTRIEPIGFLRLIYDRYPAGSQLLAHALVITQRTLAVTLGTVVVLILIVYFYVARPVERVVGALTNIQAEAPQNVRLPELPGHEQDELGQWVAVANRMLGTISDQQRARLAAEARLDFETQFDRLTGLANRSRYYRELEAACERANGVNGKVALVFCDLREFHHINDEYGIAVGDNLLREVAQRLKGSVTGNDLVARLGGDRFGIMLVELPDITSMRDVCDRILRHMKPAFLIGEHVINIHISLGVAVFPDDGVELERLAGDAEKALTMAKAHAQSWYQFFYQELGDQVRGQHRLRHDLEKAVENDELVLYYQPQFELGSGRLTGVEALMRWNHPVRGRIPPSLFIPLAEQSGMIERIGDWALGRACHQAACWPAIGGNRPPRVAVNLSARQLSSERLVDRIQHHLRSANLSPEQLEIEITESAAIENINLAANMLGRLRDIGIRIALDDFGTGQASLSYLQQLPLNKLKIDRGFIRDLGSSEESIAIVRTIIALGRTLNLEVIAEGVEQESELSLLVEERCDEVQGFLLSHPLKPEALARLMSSAEQLPAALTALLQAEPKDRRLRA